MPDSLDDARAVFTEPLAAAFEILEQVHVEPGRECVVLGDGKLGLLVAQVLHEWSSPEINYPLTGSNISRYRAGLVAGTHPFATRD